MVYEIAHPLDQASKTEWTIEKGNSQDFPFALAVLGAR
jgi:hypothetical protein